MTRPPSKVAVVGERALAIDRRVNHHGLPAQRALDVLRHVMADRDHSGGVFHAFRAFAIGIPTGRAEREKLRGVRQVDHTAGRGVLRFAQQAVPQIFARYQHPVGMEFANLPAQHLNAASRIFHREDRDRFVKAELRAFPASAADDAARVSRPRHLVHPDEVAARGASPRRSIAGIGRQQNPHAL